LLADRDSDVRIATASWLSRIGRKEGVALLLQEEEFYTPLNALRNPEGWDRLRTRKVAGDLEGTPLELGTRLARQAGLELEWRTEDRGLDVEWLLQRWRIRNRNGRLTVAEAVEELMKATDGDYDAVVEADRLLVLPIDEALRFQEERETA